MTPSAILQYFQPGSLIVCYQQPDPKEMAFLVVDVDFQDKTVTLLGAESGRVEKHTSANLLYTIQYYQSCLQLYSPEGVKQDLSIFHPGFAA